MNKNKKNKNILDNISRIDNKENGSNKELIDDSNGYEDLSGEFEELLNKQDPSKAQIIKEFFETLVKRSKKNDKYIDKFKNLVGSSKNETDRSWLKRFGIWLLGYPLSTVWNLTKDAGIGIAKGANWSWFGIWGAMKTVGKFIFGNFGLCFRNLFKKIRGKKVNNSDWFTTEDIRDMWFDDLFEIKYNKISELEFNLPKNKRCMLYKYLTKDYINEAILSKLKKIFTGTSYFIENNKIYNRYDKRSIAKIENGKIKFRVGGKNYNRSRQCETYELESLLTHRFSKYFGLEDENAELLFKFIQMKENKRRLKKTENFIRKIRAFCQKNTSYSEYSDLLENDKNYNYTFHYKKKGQNIQLLTTDCQSDRSKILQFLSTPAEQIKAIKTKKKKTYIHHEDTIYYVDTCKNDLEEEKICLIRVGNYNSKKKEIQTFDKGLNIEQYVKINLIHRKQKI